VTSYHVHCTRRPTLLTPCNGQNIWPKHVVVVYNKYRNNVQLVGGKSCGSIIYLCLNITPYVDIIRICWFSTCMLTEKRPQPVLFECLCWIAFAGSDCRLDKWCFRSQRSRNPFPSPNPEWDLYIMFYSALFTWATTDDYEQEKIFIQLRGLLR